MSAREQYEKPSPEENPRIIMRFRLSRYKKVRRPRKVIPIFAIILPIGLIAGIAFLGQFIGRENLDNWREGDSGNDNDNPTTYKTDMTFITIDGQTIKLADHQGQVVILYFFDLDCPPCGPEADVISNVDDYYSNSLVFIVLMDVHYWDLDAGLNQFKIDHSLERQVVRDDSSYTYSTPFNIAYTPATIILDKDGAESNKFIGYDANHETQMENLIDTLL